MRIISKNTLVNYYKRNEQAKLPLEIWYKEAKRAKWANFAEMKQSFNSVDSVGNQHYVFNIKGNDYRLVVVVQFSISTIYIRFVGTHNEYNKIKDIKTI